MYSSLKAPLVRFKIQVGLLNKPDARFLGELTPFSIAELPLSILVLGVFRNIPSSIILVNKT